MIQIGGVYTTLCQEKGILLQKYRDRNGRCIAILFKSIGSGVDVILLNNIAAAPLRLRSNESGFGCGQKFWTS